MTPEHFKGVMKDIIRNTGSKNQYPICAFMLRNGHIFTGHWLPLSTACNVLVVTLADKEAPPIYVSVVAIDAVALSDSMPMGRWPR